jgi:hypothetical protein
MLDRVIGATNRFGQNLLFLIRFSRAVAGRAGASKRLAVLEDSSFTAELTLVISSMGSILGALSYLLRVKDPILNAEWPPRRPAQIASHLVERNALMRVNQLGYRYTLSPNRKVHCEAVVSKSSHFSNKEWKRE